MPDDDGEETVDEIVERKLAERLEAEEKKRNRNKPPKDFGDAVDRIADAVLDRLDLRVAERRQAAEDADQEPDRTNGEGKSGFAKLWGG